MIDNTTPVGIPRRPRTLYRRAEPTIYEQEQSDINALGGVFYIGRFLKHFIPVKIIFPLPEKQEFLRPVIKELLKNLEAQDNIISLSVPVEDRRPYRAKRFVETFEIDRDDPQWAGGHAFMRVDYGDTKSMTAVETNNVIERVHNVMSQEKIDRVLLADYDLGLFTSNFLEKLKGIFLVSNIPIIIYSGRKWRKYATLPNCSIIADTCEAIAEVSEIEDFNDQDKMKGFSEYILSGYPNVINFVLVDSKSTTVISRYSEKQSSSRNIYSVDTEFKNPRTPVGHRALIASYLCYKGILKKYPCDWLPSAHGATAFNGAVLIDKLNQQVERIIDQNSNPLKINTVEISPAEILLYHLCLKRYTLRLKELSTGLPRIYTTNNEYKKEIQDILRQFREKTIPTSLFNSDTGHLIQKLLVYGPPGSGKSTIAESIAQILAEGSEYNIFNCNDTDLPDDPVEITKEIEKIIGGENKVVILDEIDKIKGKGMEVQQLLLPHFDNMSKSARSVAPKRESVVILICSTELEALQKKSASNLPDFYSRFSSRLTVPNLKSRPLDSAIAFSVALLDKGVNRISLQGLIAVVEKQCVDFRDVMFLVEKVAKRVHDGGIVNDQDCVHEGLEAILRVEPNVTVSIDGEPELSHS